MRLDSLQYANLADHCYDHDNELTQLAEKGKIVPIEGVEYKVLKHVERPLSGYQGTTYQHVESGAIVVAHRGTEPDRELFREVGLARERGQRHFSINECLKVVPLIPFFLLASASGLQGCVSTDSQGLQRSVLPNEAVTVSKDMVTIENLMRWALKGPVGTDKVIAGLRQIATFEEVQPSQFFSDGPIELVDGYVLSFSDFHLRGRSIDIGVEQNPCFSTELAMAITKATASPVTRDAHGIDRGKFYVVDGNGVTVSFTITPLTYECVNSIYVDPAYRRHDK